MSFATTLLYIIAVICLVWVLYDVWTNQKRMKQSHKILWSIAAVVFSIITAAVYYFIIKKD